MIWHLDWSCLFFLQKSIVVSRTNFNFTNICRQNNFLLKALLMRGCRWLVIKNWGDSSYARFLAFFGLFFLHRPKEMIAIRVVILKGHLHEIFNSGILTFLHFFHYHVLDLDSRSLVQEPVMELFLGLVGYVPSWNDLVLEERVQIYLLRAGELNDKSKRRRSLFVSNQSLSFIDWNLLIYSKHFT